MDLTKWIEPVPDFDCNGIVVSEQYSTFAQILIILSGCFTWLKNTPFTSKGSRWIIFHVPTLWDAAQTCLFVCAKPLRSEKDRFWLSWLLTLSLPVQITAHTMTMWGALDWSLNRFQIQVRKKWLVLHYVFPLKSLFMDWLHNNRCYNNKILFNWIS